MDNTLCYTEGNNYNESKPYIDRIQFLNNLKDSGHNIIIWTARGSKTGTDHTELTLQQLKEWNVKYDDVLFGKPDYDIYIDDKSYNVDSYWRIPKSESNITKKLKTETVVKGWGKEIVFVNNIDYCGKILCFNKNKQFSMHYHIDKKETWYVAQGKFILHWIETTNGTIHSEYLNVGDVITNERGEPHQVMALEDDSQLFEVSTKHMDCDSYRIWKGD